LFVAGSLMLSGIIRTGGSLILIFLQKTRTLDSLIIDFLKKESEPLIIFLKIK